MSAASPTRTRVLAQARFETRTLLANGEQLLVSLLLPAVALLALALGSVPDLGPGRRVDLAVAGALALAVVSTAFTGQAISTGFDRRAGVLRLFGATPLGRDGLLLGKAGAVVVVLTVQVVVLGALGAALGWRPAPLSVVPTLVTILLGGAGLVALALLLAGTVRAEAVLAIANLVWVAFLALGTVVPTDQLPSSLATVAALLPGGAVGDAMRAAFAGDWPWSQWGVLLAWGAAAALGARRLFRWSG